jgi:hypothetical protein
MISSNFGASHTPLSSYSSTRCHNSEDHNWNNPRHEGLKPYAEYFANRVKGHRFCLMYRNYCGPELKIGVANVSFSFVFYAAQHRKLGADAVKRNVYTGSVPPTHRRIGFLYWQPKYLFIYFFSLSLPIPVSFFSSFFRFCINPLKTKRFSFI